jgi:NADP-dependent aldehyde dehydrogenase
MNCGRAAFFTVNASEVLKNEALTHEVFGSSSLLVRCKDEAELLNVLEKLEGQLTATLHVDAEDHALAARLLPTLERKAGRILANGWPTGVEVSHAIVHGGPFPSTSDGRSTSVGTLAIERFLRPVCYQDLPDALLPALLKQNQQSSVPHRFDGEYKSGK